MISTAEPFDVIIYLSQTKNWDNFHRTPMIKTFAKHLGKRGGKILCVERPVCPFITPIRDWNKFSQWIKGQKGIRQEAENLFLYTPSVFFHDRIGEYIPYGVLANRRKLSIELQGVLKQLGFTSNNRLSWIYSPLQINYLDLIKEKMVVYECYDAYSLHPRISSSKKKKLEKRESKILEEAHLVFVNSNMLLKKLKIINTNTFPLFASAEINHFLRGPSNGVEIPEDIQKIAPPRIGYIGSIYELLDFDLINFIAKEQPHWSICMIGPIDKNNAFLRQKNYQKSKELPNIYYLGPKPYALLPDYLFGLDVCLLPYRVIQYVHHMYHNKIFQYLSAGKPVVSTNFFEAYNFKDVMYLAENPPCFIDHINTSLNEEKTESLIEKRRKIAIENSWDKRIEDMLNVIDNYIGQF